MRKRKLRTILFSAQQFLTLHGGTQGGLWTLGTCYHDPIGRKGQTRLLGVQDTAVALLLCCSYLSRKKRYKFKWETAWLAAPPAPWLQPSMLFPQIFLLPQSLPSRVTWGKGLLTSWLRVPCFVGTKYECHAWVTDSLKIKAIYLYGVEFKQPYQSTILHWMLG